MLFISVAVERKAIASKSSRGLNILFDCLKDASATRTNIIVNILHILKCLAEHRYKGM